MKLWKWILGATATIVGLFALFASQDKGKKVYDKRQVKKNRDWTREKARILSNSKK